VGGLKEAGVLLGPGELDINRILKQLTRRSAERELQLLDRQHKRFYSQVGWNTRIRATPSYKEWFDSPARSRWKILLFSTVSNKLSDVATKGVREEFGRKPHDWIWSERPTVRETDWVLCGFIARRKLQRLSWLFAERVIAVPKSDRYYYREFPYEVVQIHGPLRASSVPRR